MAVPGGISRGERAKRVDDRSVRSKRTKGGEHLPAFKTRKVALAWRIDGPFGLWAFAAPLIGKDLIADNGPPVMRMIDGKSNPRGRIFAGIRHELKRSGMPVKTFKLKLDSVGPAVLERGQSSEAPP